MVCSMDADIVTALEVITRNIKYYLTSENVIDGILEDVETIISSVNTTEPIDEPAIWIIQHPTIVNSDNKINLSAKQLMETTFEFVCVEYDDDLEIAENKGINLATRVAKSIIKNFNRNNCPNDPSHIFQNVIWEALYPVGEVSIEGKAKKVPATSVVLKFTYNVNWIKCRKE